MDDGTARRFAMNSLHNYFFVKGLDAVHEGGIVAFITSQGVMNSAMGTPVRQYLMERARLLSAIRLPNNLFTDYAGTEVGSDLIVLQKDTASGREYTGLEKAFVEVSTQADSTTQNEYFERTAAIVHTRGHVGTDPYGKPARVFLHPLLAGARVARTGGSTGGKSSGTHCTGAGVIHAGTAACRDGNAGGGCGRTAHCPL